MKQIYASVSHSLAIATVAAFPLLALLPAVFLHSDLASSPKRKRQLNPSPGWPAREECRRHSSPVQSQPDNLLLAFF